MASQLKLAKFWGKRRANSSNVWDHFGFRSDEKGIIIDKTKAVCKYCEAEVKYVGGSTSNLTSHYNNHHVGQKRSVSEQPTIRSALAVNRKYPRSSSHHLMLERRVAEYLIADLRPFSTVESQSFRNLCTSLDPKFDLPGKATFFNVAIPKMYKETKQKVEELLKIPSGIAVTADGWTSTATQSYMTLTGHFITEGWTLMNVGLQTRHTPESHTAENLKTLFEAALNEWKLANKEVSGVVDNAKNITKAWQLLGRQSINCFAHTMNLAVKKAMAIASLEGTVVKTRKLVNHFHHSNTHTKALKNQQEVLNLPRQKVKMDVETRWNSTYDMIESVLASKEAISQVLIGDRMYRHLILTAEEITLLEEMKDILKPWKELTVRLSSEKEVTISLITLILHRLLTKELQPKEMDSDLGIQMKAAMREDLGKRYKDADVKGFLHLASLLDPRFKSLPFLSSEEREAAQTNLQARALQLEEQRVQIQAIKEEKPTVESALLLPSLDGNEVPAASAVGCKQEIPSPSASPVVKKKKEDQDSFFDDFFGDLIVTKVEKSIPLIDRFQEELKMYLSLDLVMSSTNVLDWWRINCVKFPLIASVAKQILCTPATSTPSERAFSKAGNLISVKRASLKPAKVDMVLFLNKNYFQV